MWRRGRARRPDPRRPSASRTSLAAVSALVAAAVLVASCGTPSSGPPAASASAATGFVVGLGVPWAVGLPAATGGHDAGEWPSFRVPALRLWDSRTTWRDLQPEPDTWDFGTLDAILATAADHGTHDITLVLAGTPQWASVRTSTEDAPWIGPGSASPPRDLREWQEYVAAVAERYRGRISAYEIGNEPNLRTFWNGTLGQWAAYVAVAAAAIRAADPAATVVADVGLIRRARDLPALGVWAATAGLSPDVDVLAVHAYPTLRTRDQMPRLLAQARSVLQAAGAGDRPLWVTEANVSDGSSLPDAGQAAEVRRLTDAVAGAGFARTYWYAWTALGPANLIQLSPGTPGAQAISELVSP